MNKVSTSLKRQFLKNRCLTRIAGIYSCKICPPWNSQNANGIFSSFRNVIFIGIDLKVFLI